MTSHERKSKGSLLCHAEIAAELPEHPELAARARLRLDRWRKSGVVHPHYASRWESVLSRPAEEIAAVITAPENDDLRQTSPFAGEITAKRRWAILRDLRNS